MDKEKLEARYRVFKGLMENQSWKYFEKDARENLVNVHKEASVSYANQGDTLNSQRQAWLATGIEEALDHLSQSVQFYESFTQRAVRTTCALCGQMVQTMKRFLPDTEGKKSRNGGR